MTRLELSQASPIRLAELARRRRAVLWIGSVFLALAVLMAGLMLALPREPEPGVALLLLGVGAVAGAAVWGAARGRVRGAAWALVLAALVSLLAGQLARHEVGFGPFYVVFAVMVAVVTLEPRDVALSVALSIGVLIVMWVTGAAYPPIHEPPLSALVNGAVTFVLLSSVGLVAAFTLHRLLADLARREADAERAREDARRSSARAELIAENTADLITLFDDARRILWASPAHQRVLGADADALNVFERRREFVHPDDFAGLLGAINTAIAGTPASCQSRVRRADGSWGWFQTVVTPVPGERIVVASTRDVTEVHALSAQLEASQKMEALGRLAGGVAHDFNNLLSVMQTCSELLAADVPSGGAAAQELADLQGAIERATGLTRQLLAFSRRDVVAPSRIEVGAVVGPMLDMVRRLLKSDIDVRLTVEPGTWPVRAAASQLEQVVMNLAVNARDAMPGGGVLELRVGPGRDPALGEVVRLSVRDTGSGMSEETRARIFEPFFTTKPPGRGTGLGLATVYGVVRSLGGRIDVETALGKGTEFRVLLPRAPAEVEAPSAPGARATRPVQRVFVVDDDAAVRALMAKVLAGSGLQVREFASGGDALAALDGDGAPDALVTDVMLPGVDGVKVAEAYLARVPGLRVVLVSGYAPDPAATARLLARGARFVPKPFSPTALVAAVSQAAGGGAPDGGERTATGPR